MAGPVIGGLDGTITRVPGEAVLVDTDVTVTGNGFPFASLFVQLWTNRTGESLGIRQVDGELELSNGLALGSRVIVGGLDIGYIDDLGADYLSFAFNDATGDQAQRLLRALTYVDTTPLDFTVGSQIDFYLQDANGDWVQAFTQIGDSVAGTDLPDIFTVDQFQMGAGDELDGGAGNDTLRLVDGGEFSLHRMTSLASIETIQGTAENDTITLAGSQLFDVRTIAGGGSTQGGDVLVLTGEAIDLTGKAVSGFREIQLRDDGADIVLDSVEVAKLVRGYFSDDDSLTLTSGFLTDAERLEIHRHGVETIIARNEAGDEIETVQEAPSITNLGEATINAQVGSTVLLDVGQDAVLEVDSGLVSFFSLSIADAQDASERIGVDASAGIVLSNAAGPSSNIFVGGVKIGYVEGLGTSSASFVLNGEATTERVQQLIRALTYTKTGGGGGDPRTIYFYLKDVAHREMDLEFSIQLQPNEAPTDIALNNTSIREYAATGTRIGDLSATDSPGSTFTYEILRSDGTWGTTDGRFKIEGSEIKVDNGVLLDYEQDQSHTIKLKVTDGGGLSFEKEFTIDVTDINPEQVMGTAGSDTIFGGAGNDRLNGGFGADRMEGGDGDDIYFVYDAGDVIVDTGGVDTVLATVDYTAHSSIEMILAGGTGGKRLTGNDGDNGIEAGDGADVLNGMGGDDRLYGDTGNDTLNGGTGADWMEGQAGNDTYYADSRYDRVVETSTGGVSDLVYASVSHTLAAYVEKLYAIGSSSISLAGNTLANTIAGNGAKNTLKGLSGNDTLNGGKGNDVLYGGTGKDIFIFATAPSSSSNKDRILDWNKTYDTIQLENAIFRKLTKTGVLNKASFVIGAAAKDANDYVGYNKVTGDLWYDANGNKAGAQVAFANIGKYKAIYYNDFVVI